MNRDARMVLPLPCRLGSYVCETARETGATCGELAQLRYPGHAHCGGAWQTGSARISTRRQRGVRPCAPEGGWDVRLPDTTTVDADQSVDWFTDCVEHASGGLHCLHQLYCQREITTPWRDLEQ